MKQQFIANLKNGQIPVAQNHKELDDYVKQGGSFSPLDTHIRDQFELGKPHWVNGYFAGKVELLRNNFSQELCKHLFEVKEHLQKKRVSGFVIDETTNVLTSEATQHTPEISPEPQRTEIDLSNYVPNDKLKNYLEAQDASAIRAFLSAELSDFRLTIEELIQVVSYVEKNAKGVFEEYKTSAFIAEIEQDESKWNGRYFDKQQGDLNQNFALERFFHLVNVRKTLMRNGDSDFQQIEPVSHNPKTQEYGDKLQNNTSETKPTESTQPAIDQSLGNGSKVLIAIIAVGGLVAFALWRLLR